MEKGPDDSIENTVRPRQMRDCFKSTRDWTSQGWYVRRPAYVPACVRECAGFAGIHPTRFGRSGAPRAESFACTHRVENKGRRAECDILRNRASFQHRLQDDLAGLGALQHSQAPGLRTGGPPCCVSETLSGRSGVASVWCHPVSVCKMLMRRKGAAGSLSRRPGSSVFTLGQGLPRFSGWTGVERRWSAQRLRLSQAL